MHNDEKEAIKIVKQELKTTQPLILHLGDDEGSNFFIVIDNKLIKVEGNITKALELLIQCFYVFDLDYPHRLLLVYRFLESICGLKHLSPTAGILELVENLRAIE